MVANSVFQYDVVLRVFDSYQDNVAVEFSYWSSSLSSAQAENVFGAFLAAITSIPQSTTVDDVQLMDESMKQQIQQWNSQLPMHVDTCTHDLILDAAQDYPDAPAIESHDGSLSYGEFDVMTGKLATHLKSLDVGHGVPVVFRMEKSLWAIVAMVGIMRAGCHFVPLDPAWPVERTQFIIDNVGASILLTTKSTPALPVQHINHTVVLSHELLNKLPTENSLLPHVKPSDPAYILYTSGSTGQPKGVVVEHQTLSSSSTAHGKAMLMDRQTRAFQFSSFTFDVSLGEIMTTLVHGGCVCIPSSDDRLSNISGAISKLRANQLFMTTTTLGTFSPEDCPSVKTVVCGGELLSQAIKDVWAPHVNLLHGYGPTEACIYAVSGHANDPNLPPSVIGHAMDGNRVWVCRPDDPRILSPIGALGELIIEGPIVAREYFNDSDRTNTSFLDRIPESWGTPSPYRLYRTGDLVRWNMDGSLTFFGRRDGQLKVRGQRCEAGDIENHLTTIEPDITHCAALVPKQGACASMLVAVLSFKTTHPVLSTTTGEVQLLDTQQVSGIIAKLQESLAQQVPGYMVPQVWLPVVSLPSTTACKTDRRRVSRWVNQLDKATLDNVLNLATTHSATPLADRSPVHKILATAWSEVLGTPVDYISDDRSFFSLGGDSILAILVVNKCRAQGIDLSVSDILRGRTINDMANNIAISDQHSTSDSSTQGHVTAAHSLALGSGYDLESPVLSQSRTAQLQLASSIDQQTLEDAVKQLIHLHPALRTTYVKEDDTWFSRESTDVSQVLLFVSHDGTEAESSALLDATEGPLLAVDYFPGGNRVAVSALHITLDLASWNLVLRDLDCILSGSPVIPHARPAMDTRASPSHTDEPAVVANLDYWELDPEETYLPHESKYELRIDADASQLLLESCSRSMLTVVDVVVAAAAESFSRSFTDRTVPVIHAADTPHTHVGYGDSVYAVQLTNDLVSSGTAVVAATAKNARLASSKENSSYMAESYTPKVLAARLPEILVRCLDNARFQGNLLQQQGDDLDTATLIPSCISITVSPNDDKSLGVVVAHSWDLGQQKKVRKWVRVLQTALLDTIRAVARANFVSRADFPLVKVSDDKAWEQLRSTINEAVGPSGPTVEDVYPCSPVQQGMLISQAKSTSSYTVDVVWKIHAPSGSSAVSIAKLENAWAKVVQRHSALRTIFVDGSAANEAFLATVLRNPSARVIHQTVVGEDAVESLLAFDPELPVASHEPPHVLTIADAQDKILVHLRINHAVVDGISLDVLQRDLHRAYVDEVGSEWSISDHSFRDYVAYVKAQDSDKSLDFWKNRLNTVSACRFPQLQVPDVAIANEKRIFKTQIDDIAPLLKLCQTNGVSISNLAQLAWALVLRGYTNNHHVCFGYMTSGRDAPVSGIESAAGVFINLVISDLALDDAMTVKEALESSRAGLADSMDHQYCPLSKVQKALDMGGEPFFNTVLSCYREDDVTPSKTGVAVDLVHLDDTSEFAIAAKIAYTRSTMELSLTYRTEVICPEAADVIGDVWLRTLQSLPSLSDTKISDISLMDPLSSKLVKRWNEHVPGPVDACLHDIITDVARIEPDKMALYSSAGTLTYAELDEFSTRLGHHLVSMGVGPEVIVPLLFEKSIWAVVAMLGVLKAGGAFVALDPAHPAERLALIISDTGSPVMVMSANQATTPLVTGDLSNLEVAMFTVTHESILELPALSDKPCPTVTPDNAAYVIFTSGSTGRPKGVVIEHRAVSTGTKEHGSQMNYTSTSRVLQFASYAFDATIGEVFTTLVYNGTVCIATETERIEDLTGFMNRASVDWAFLTPAVARMMTPSDVPTLETLICGGEPIGDLTPRIWSEIKFIQAYGPTETCVFASISDRQHREVRPAIIGHMMGSAAWVVSPSNSDLLVPVGAVGEMLIEGPILGRGYRNDPDKTDASFIRDPEWSVHYPRHSNGRRLYKTGDLVRYNLDGSMDFVQRKDTQIKIRGQRVEAGEIESHVTSAHKDVQHVYVTFVKNGRLSSRLVAIISLKGFGSTESSSSGSLQVLKGDDYDRAKELLRTVTEYLSSKLPRHMVPAVWAVVEGSSVPLTTSGKIDRRLMTNWLEKADEDLVRQILALGQEESVSDDSLTSTEVTIRSVWALVLNLDPQKINSEHRFFSLGGDSITAMQVVSHCRSQGIALTVKDIFKHQTIASLAAFVDYDSAGKIGAPATGNEFDLSDPVEENFALSPIQKMFFDIYPDGVNHFNQSFLVQIASGNKVASPTLHAALNQLVSRHSMLRARYTRSQGQWVQRVTDDVNGSLQYQEHKNTSLGQISNLIDLAQQSLDIQHGPIVSAKLIQLPSRQILALVAHHLVVDMVSWRVLLEELEAILTGKPLAPASVQPVPFQAWVRVQSTLAEELSAHNVLPYPVPEPRQDYWGIDLSKSNGWASTREISFELNEAMTKAILGPCNEPLQTDPQDLFLAAAFRSFAQAFPDRPLPAIFTEGHGRDADVDVDLSRTVGWFTCIVPVALAQDVPEDLLETTMRIKDSRRSVPGHGVPYFSYRYMSGDGVTGNEFRQHDQMEILFNYHGQYQQLERDGALLQTIPEGEFAQRDVDHSARRLAVFDISVAVVSGRARVSMLMPQSLAPTLAQQVEVWSDSFQDKLADVVYKTSTMKSEFTLNDTPLIKDMSYPNLAEMKTLCLEHTGRWGPGSIEEIFPCSPMQEGILLSQMRTPELYDVRFAFEVSSHDSSPQVSRLHEAWEQVVKRQPMLRTVFLPNLRGSGSFDQAILRKTLATVHHIELEELAEPSSHLVKRVLETMEKAPASSFEYGKVPHELSIYTVGDRMFILLRLSHALVDGASLPYIIKDLQQAYMHKLPAALGLGYRELVSFIQKQPMDEALEYWSGYLDGAGPCRLPLLLDDAVIPSPGKLEARDIPVPVPDAKALRSLCAKYGVTMASIFHAAWALILRAYIGDDEVHFGYLASGRDAPIQGITSLIGPLINMLICRVNFDRSKTVAQLLQDICEDFASSMSNQYASLAQVQHSLGLGSESLFTTVVSFQRHDPSSAGADGGSDGIKLTGIDSRDPTEYDVSLNVVDSDQELSFTFTYWTSKISSAHATHMIRALLSALTSFAENVDQPIVNVNLVSPETRSELDSWNAIGMQELHTECVHTLFEQQVEKIPDQQAICAWDGNFTYRELNEASNAFAHHLHSLGETTPKPDEFVITCFDKSAWVTVSQMAILKAGAAFAAVDPTYPIVRVKTIVNDLRASVLFTETKYKDRFQGIFSKVIVVDQEMLDSIGGPQLDAPSTPVNGNNLSYSIFTSGSTGQPKGILIEHQSLSTVAKHFAKPYQIDQNTRTLQFAAYTFDLSVGETFMTLLNGGCLCITSERRRLEDLTGAINDFQVNWAFLTPTMADILDPAQVPSMKSLALAGEAATSENIRKWHDKVHFVIAYGPAETTICCNATDGVKATSDPANFGPARGAGIWVADMDDPSILLPVGAVGELLVEGPIVGRGYVDPVKTAEVFIDPPTWLTTQYPRVYRSGDIVRYNPDGTCSFVRRRDNQVKVRGQRIELNEVEVHVSQADADLQHTVVLLPKTGACQGRLTTVLSRHQQQEKVEAQRVLCPVTSEEDRNRNATVRNKLSSTLPGYMIPKIWITVEQLPLTTNGKMDRRKIQDWVHALTEQELAAIVSSIETTATGTQDTRKLTPMEEQLVKAWSQVLNLPASSLPLDQSFTSLGGDSISAMQIVSRARECGVTVSVDKVLRSESLSELANHARFKALAPNSNEIQSLVVEKTEPFPLLPIQRMFFEMNPSGNNHFNQTFTVRLSKTLSAERIESTIATVVKHHPMLRARFLKDHSGDWTQQIVPDAESSLGFRQQRFASLSDAVPVLDELQTSLDIQNGPLVASCLINLPDAQVLSLAAHHLVVDLVSWRVILSDLEILLSSDSKSLPSLAPAAVTMPAWTDALLSRAKDYNVESVLPFTVPSANFGFWDMDNGRENVMADTVVIQSRLDASSTAALLGRANIAFRTDPDDLMLAALVFSFLRVFPERSVPTIYAEGHGRNAWDDSIDLSRTVGWFTTMYPLVASATTRDLVETVRQVKDIRHSIREKGFPYFASRYLTAQGRDAFKEHTNMEVLFNYLGQYQQLQQSDTVLRELQEPLEIQDAAPSTPRMALIDILAAVEGSELVLSIGYNGRMGHRDRLQLWLNEYTAALRSLSTELPTMSPSFTPGDFPLLGIDDAGLKSLAATCKAKVGSLDPAMVESIYPCSPLQQGILVSQSQDAKSYIVYAAWKIRPARGTSFNVNQLKDAWRRLVRYHPVLRTVFCENGTSDGGHAQVLLRADTAASEPIIKEIQCQRSDVAEFLRSSAPSLPTDKPPHILSICTTDDGTYVSLQVSHALIDGTSMNLVMDDLVRSYNGNLQGSGPSYNDYISHICSEPIARSLSYWTETLADTQPCLFPVLSTEGTSRVLNKITLDVPSSTTDAMRQLGRAHAISVSNIFQLAWSLVLRAFTGSDSVCFGYLTSGRDVPVDRIEAMVGPLISMLVSSTQFGSSDDEAQSALDLLKSINRSYIDSLPHQHCSLGSIQNALGVSNTGLFNTVMSLQKINEEAETPEEFGFDLLDSHDPSEYNMTLNILDFNNIVELHFTYWTDKLSDSYASSVVDATLRAVEALVKDPSRKMPVVDLVGDSERQGLVSRINQHHQTLQTTVHALIEAQVKAIPENCAVTSWEGDLSYAELDRHATRLAVHLRSLGVGPEVTVPLCFKKSIWTVVAILAVMKAGGVFVPLDPAHPADRIKGIVEQLPSRIVALTSPQCVLRVAHLVDNTISVDASSIAQLGNVSSAESLSPGATPSNAVYIIFTSGSTGQPKGVVLEHSAAASGTTAHGRDMSYSRESRVLQFSSYSFDASILEIITTLVYGGCICVLSEEERINDLVGGINRLRVNWAFLTPAVAMMVEPSQVPTLRLLALGGAPLWLAVLQKWTAVGTIRVVNGYGPTECCALSTHNYYSRSYMRPEVIGKAMGCNTWVVDPRDPNILMPIGAVGELLIEGPIVARGYLNDLVKTQDAFLNGVSWLPSGRLYRTGDIVSYATEGNGDKISYIRRKDTQVKVRGQRIELGEISYQIGASHGSIVAHLVVLGSRGKFSGQIVAIFALDGFPTHQQGNDEPLQLLDSPQDLAKVRDIISEVSEFISDKLPSSMQPSAMVPVNRMPINTSGKIEARRVSAWVDGLDDATYARIMRIADEPDDEPDNEPEANVIQKSEAEDIIRAVVAEVVNVPLEQVPLRRSFFAIGGDSISAMAVVSRCRSRGITFTVSDIFKHKTITALAQFVSQSTQQVTKKDGDGIDRSDEVNVDFSLSPIQQMFFDMYPDGVNHFNQSFLVQLPSTEALTSTVVHEAIRQLVDRHSMLRARFSDEDGDWVQRVTPSGDAKSLKYQVHNGVNVDQVVKLIDVVQTSLDIRTGPVMAASLLNLTDKRRILVLVAHHLVIDMVSWRVLLEELEVILSGNGHSLQNMPTSLPFQAWVRTQPRRVSKWSPSRVLPYDIPKPRMDYWLKRGEDNTCGDTRELGFTLDADATKALLGSCNEAFQTDPQDLFLAAAFQSFADAFPDRGPPAIFVEGHGRGDGASEGLDLSRTVGWFTSIVPVALPDGVVATNVVDTLMRIKDVRRSVPGQGVPYFSYRYLSAAGVRKFRNHDKMEILFNYFGQYQQLERDDALLRPVVGDEFPQYDADASVERLAIFDVAGAVTSGRASVTITMPGTLAKARVDGVSLWLDRLKHHLTSLVQVTSDMSTAFTLHDLPLIKNMSYDELSDMREVCLEHTGLWGPGAIEEIFPCSPIQQGILLSQAHRPDLYDVRVALEVSSRNGSLSAQSLGDAWRHVVQRQPMLRTVFLPNMRGNGSFDQAVLRDPVPSIRHVDLGDATDDEMALQTVKQSIAETKGDIFSYGKLPHEFTTYTIGNKTFVFIRLSHALVDGFSLPIVLNDLREAFAHRLSTTPGLSYRELVSFINQQPADQAIGHWVDFLKGSTPCRLPPLLDDASVPSSPELLAIEVEVPCSNALRALCAEHGVTMAIVFQLAWALVLRAYTGEDDVMFGYLTSGRDAPIEGVSTLVGPLINMLTCRAIFNDRNKTVLQLLSQLQDDFINGISNQHVSLAEIQHHLGIGSEGLFTSIISFQRHDAAAGAANDDDGLLKMTPIDGRDPTEYDLSVNVLDEADKDIQIHFTHWTSKASPSHAKHMMQALSAALVAISTKPDQPLVKVDLVGAETRREMDAWNATGIQFVSDDCIHNIIERNSQATPDRQAIYGWDRTFTYGELDQAANAFAHHIQFLVDLKPDTFVATCFDKSAWTIVAQLAILKSGGAFVAIDPTHPADRVETILSELGSPPILLTESKHQERFKMLFPNIVTVNENTLSSLSVPNGPPSTRVGHSNTAYAIFTSGSTGQPKGIVIEHGSLSTAALTHAGPYQITSDTRALQFAAYTFDVSIGETFYPLSQGGCVCVPSDSARLEDLAGAINGLSADWAFLTPTVADLLDPSLVPGLKTLVLGGEAPTSVNIRRWHDKVFLISGYGPAETTIWCNATGRLNGSSDPANLGPPMGARVWVTDADDPSVLLPVGAVGELLIEGPLVSRGYTDPEKTAAAFISPPGWMTTAYPGKLIYRSGDIGRSRPDGTFSFVRRRDNQVKVRGQRVELNEVEVHISQAETSIRHAVVLYPKSGACQGRLTAVLSHHSLGGEELDQKQTVPGSGGIIAVQSDEAISASDLIQDRLLSTLPPYMIPKIWITVEHLPSTTNGKMDRRQILTWVESLTDDNLASIVQRQSNTTGSVESPTKPKTKMEEHFLQIWSNALNLPADSIPHNQPFTSLGGDSITAMQVLARARERGITTTVHDILRSRSIADLAGRSRFKNIQMNGSDDSKALTVITDQPFALLPIQRLFFRTQTSVNNHFNQSFIVRLSRTFTADQARAAIRAIVEHHPMLRARFLTESNEWKQKISSDIAGSFKFQHHHCSSLSDSIETLDELQASLNISQGPLLTSCLLELSDGQALFLAAHHLVVDLVSWRVILADLEKLLAATSGATSLPSLEQEGISLPAWTEALIQKSTEYDINSVLPFTVPAADFSFWDMDPAKETNIMADTASLQVRVDGASTAALLGPANAAFGTDPDDLMIAALIFSFRSIFHERSSIPAVYTESHGRNAWDDDIDLSRTVGWLTTIYPVAVSNLHNAERDLLRVVRQVKDIRRSIPGKGLPYFAYRYLIEEGRAAFEHHDDMEILFNYLGQYQQLQKTDTIIQQIRETTLSTQDASDSTNRLALMDVVAAVEGSELVLSLGYNTKMQHKHRFQAWLDSFKYMLETLASQLPAIPATFTPSDLPLLSLGEDGLSTLAAACHAKVGSWSPDVVEASYPCSPLQQGILLSQAKDESAYVVSGIWKVSPTKGGSPVNLDQLQNAWRRLVQYHQILRTVFCESGRSDGIYAQVVLRENATAAQPTIEVRKCDGPDPLAFLHSSTPALPSDKPPHALLICDAGTDVYLSFNISHALMDGTSLGLMMDDLLRGYHGTLEGVGPSYEPYIAHIYNKPASESLSYWSDTLANARPCHFPVLVDAEGDDTVRSLNKIMRPVPGVEAMRQLSRTHGVSIANFFQVAWALVLRAFTGSDDICFGYLTSGRDVPVDRIEEIVGPLISMLVSSADFSMSDGAPSAIELLQTMNSAYVDSLPHQHCSLADIQRVLRIGNKGLFNTALSLQRVTTGDETQDQIEINVVEGDDPSEVSELESTLTGNTFD